MRYYYFVPGNIFSSFRVITRYYFSITEILSVVHNHQILFLCLRNIILFSTIRYFSTIISDPIPSHLLLIYIELCFHSTKDGSQPGLDDKKMPAVESDEDPSSEEDIEEDLSSDEDVSSTGEAEDDMSISSKDEDEDLDLDDYVKENEDGDVDEDSEDDEEADDDEEEDDDSGDDDSEEEESVVSGSDDDEEEANAVDSDEE